MRERNDFVQVQLTAAGIKAAGEGGSIRVATAQMQYVFTATAPVEVLKFAEWAHLQNDCDGDGQPLFELYEVSAKAEPAATVKEEI